MGGGTIWTRDGVPPHLDLGWGYPLSRPVMGVPPPVQTWDGIPHPILDLRWGSPHPQDGVPPNRDVNWQTSWKDYLPPTLRMRGVIMLLQRGWNIVNIESFVFCKDYAVFFCLAAIKTKLNWSSVRTLYPLAFTAFITTAYCCEKWFVTRSVWTYWHPFSYDPFMFPWIIVKKARLTYPLMSDQTDTWQKTTSGEIPPWSLTALMMFW